MKLREPFPQKLHILHIVRRYGCVGGMERYVWELTTQLQMLGHRVTVICEHCYHEKPIGIDVYELGKIVHRPRWLSALRFDRRWRRWLNNNPQPDAIIHSHERVSLHDITTFHGSLSAIAHEKSWWRFFSLRIAMNLYLERRELAVAKLIVPNSQLVKQQLARYYPSFASKLSAPISPGVNLSPSKNPHAVSSKGGVIGFIGNEWKRKGLPFAAAVVEKLRLTRPNLLFIVKGPNPHDVQHLFVNWKSGGYILREWDTHVDFAEFDVLLHPAKTEPYGMAISEAMEAQIPVVVSNMCGACEDIAPESGEILSVDAPIDQWVNAIENQLNRTERPPKFERSWRKVAQEYENTYSSISFGVSSFSNVGSILNFSPPKIEQM